MLILKGKKMYFITTTVCSVAKSWPHKLQLARLPCPYLPEFAQTHAHRVSDVIQPSHPLSPLSLLPSNFPYYSECYTSHICLLSYIQENIYIIKVSQYLDSKGYTENLGQAPPQVIMFMNIFVYHQQSECLWDQQSIYFFLESQIKLYLYIWWVTII